MLLNRKIVKIHVCYCKLRIQNDNKASKNEKVLLKLDKMSDPKDGKSGINMEKIFIIASFNMVLI